MLRESCKIGARGAQLGKGAFISESGGKRSNHFRGEGRGRGRPSQKTNAFVREALQQGFPEHVPPSASPGLFSVTCENLKTITSKTSGKDGESGVVALLRLVVDGYSRQASGKVRICG